MLCLSSYLKTANCRVSPVGRPWWPKSRRTFQLKRGCVRHVQDAPDFRSEAAEGQARVPSSASLTTRWGAMRLTCHRLALPVSGSSCLERGPG
eukprot:3941407-Rhodomonas_salina.5